MKSRRILSLVVAAILLVSTLTVVGFLSVTAAETEIGDAAGLAAITGDGNYKLTADIDLAGSDFTTIASFAGTFDGNGKRITGISTPLFDTLSGTVKNVTLEGAITTDATTAIGALANKAGGTVTVEDVTNKVNVTATASTAVGGFIGEVRGEFAVTVTSSVNDGIITSTNAQGTAGFIGSTVGAGEKAHAVATFTDCTNNAAITMTGTASDAGTAGFIGYGHRYTATLTACVNNGDITANGTGMGGFFGCAKWSSGATNVDDIFEAYYCANYGDITATNTSAQGPGGIAGRLSRCDGSAYVISYCYNVGNVTGGDRAGGIFAYTNDVDGTIKVEGCYTVGTLTSGSYTHIIGLTGKRKPSVTTSNYYIGSYTPKTDESYYNQEKYFKAVSCVDKAELNTALVALGEYVVDPTLNDGYAILKWQCTHGSVEAGCLGDMCTVCGTQVNTNGSGNHAWGEWEITTPATDLDNGEKTRTCTVCGASETEVIVATGGVAPIDGVYHVENEAQLVWVMYALNSGNVPVDAHIVLDSDIALTDGMGTLAESKSFSGILDGQGHTITGLKDVIFFYLSGTVKNLTVDGEFTSTNKRTGSISRRTTSGAVLENVHSSVDFTLAAGDGNVGGLIGYAISTITLTNCSYDGTITYSWTSAKAGVGGIVGYSNADGGKLTMTNCIFNGSIVITAADAVAENELYAGGLIGYGGTGGKHEITYCTNTGSLTINKAGDKFYTGGIVGKFTLDAGAATYSVFNGTITAGNSPVGAIVGSSTRAGALIEHCVDLTDAEYPVCGDGSYAEINFYNYETIETVGEPFTVGSVGYQKYNFGYINTTTSELVATMQSDGLAKAYLSFRDDAAKHDLRFAFLTDLEALGEGTLTVTVTFTKGSETVKTSTGVVANAENALTRYQSLVAAGKSCFAADGFAFYTLVVEDITDGEWDAVTVTVTNESGTAVVNGVGIGYADIAG